MTQRLEIRPTGAHGMRSVVLIEGLGRSPSIIEPAVSAERAVLIAARWARLLGGLEVRDLADGAGTRRRDTKRSHGQMLKY